MNKIIINVDETWIGMTDFRRRKWQVKEQYNSVAKMQVYPRVSMILGIDTRGQIYVSLIQSNSNASTMRIFFQQLVKKLEEERPYWHKNTIIMLDNATYHTCGTTMKLFEELGVPVLFTGSHSYSASPVELTFAAFKSKDINPSWYSTGKK